MPWPPQDDTPPKPPENANGFKRDFSPLVKLAMRMGWIGNLYTMTPEGVMPPMDVMLPFTYVAAYEDPQNDKVFVFGVIDGKGRVFEEDRTLFPNDGFIARLKLLKEVL